MSATLFTRLFVCFLAFTLAACGGKGSSGTSSTASNAPSVNIQSVAPGTPAVGDVVALTATGSGNGLSYAWNFGDGQTATGAAVSHAFTQPGTFAISVVATDTGGLTATAQASLVVSPVPIAATISSIAPAGPWTGQVVTLTGSGKGQGTLTYAWTFGDGGTGSGATVTHTYTKVGSYPVVMTVTDSSGASAKSVSSVTVVTAVTAGINASTSTPDVGQKISFTSSATGVSPLSYAWKFGDNTTDTSANPSHIFGTAGNFTVSLVVTDALAHTAQASLVISTSGAPTAQIKPAVARAVVNSATTFTGVGTGQGTLAYAWDFGDGTTGTGATTTHTYTTPGTYPVSLTVTDVTGLSATASDSVTAAFPVPTATIVSSSPNNPVAGQPTSFQGAGTGRGTLVYAWDFGDNTTAAVVAPTHIYAHGGTYTVKLTVTDSTNVSSSVASATVTVTNPPAPSALAITPSQLVQVVNAPITFTASASGSSPLTYNWNFGDNGTGTGISAAHSYTTAGSYTVIMSVTDPVGQRAQASATITVVSSAKIADGYVANATITLDVNDDRICDPTTEPTTQADAAGSFMFPSNLGEHMMCASGGTDLGTGQPLIGVLMAPAGATVITPMTTLVMAQLNINNPPVFGVASPAKVADVNTAVSLIATQLGLDGVNLLTSDPVALAVTRPGLAQTTAGLQALLVQTTALLQAAGGGGNVSAVSATTKALYADVVTAANTVLLSQTGPLSTTTLGNMAGALVMQATINAQADTSLSGLTGLASLSPVSMSTFTGPALTTLTDTVSTTASSVLLTQGSANLAAQAQADVAVPNTVAALAQLLLTTAAGVPATELAAISTVALPISASGLPVAASSATTVAAINANAPGITVPSTVATMLSTANDMATVVSLTANQFQTLLNSSSDGQALLQVASTPKCGFDVYHLDYGTVGAGNESTRASGALMIPTGSDPACTGPRPMVLYAHGTSVTRSFNMAAINDPSNPAYAELTLVAAMFAAQGYIVVAPNYAGYDSSPLLYHPYLNALQQSKEMISALTAARTTLPGTPAGAATTDSGKLFVTGYSEGGYVAMATMNSMQAQGLPVTAGAPMSGPYAMALFGDAIFGGSVNVGGTLFAPLLATSYQRAYGNLYNGATDIYNPLYAAGLPALLPGPLSEDQLFTQGILPASALFQANPAAPYTALDAISPASSSFAFGFDSTNYLIQNSFRAAYVNDAVLNPDQVTAGTGYLPATSPGFALRQDLKFNDMRGFKPSMPVLMCGGDADPTVFFQPNAQTMYATMTAVGAPNFALLDVAATSNALSSTGLTVAQLNALAPATAAAQSVFSTAQQNTYSGTYTNAYNADISAGMSATAAAADATLQANVAVARAYHGSLVPPACTLAARSFFQLYQ